MTQEQIQLLRVHRRHQQRLTDRSHTTVAEARPYDYDTGSQPTQPGSRAREDRDEKWSPLSPPMVCAHASLP
jgi:hypothetical protein